MYVKLRPYDAFHERLKWASTKSDRFFGRGQTMVNHFQPSSLLSDNFTVSLWLKHHHQSPDLLCSATLFLPVATVTPLLWFNHLVAGTALEYQKIVQLLEFPSGLLNIGATTYLIFLKKSSIISNLKHGKKDIFVFIGVIMKVPLLAYYKIKFVPPYFEFCVKE